MTASPIVELVVLPAETEGLDGACCSLAGDELRMRLAEWRALRDRARRIERLDEGLRLHLAPEEPIDEVARLVAAESACCPFYRFTISLTGSERTLTIDAGAGNRAAVHALLGLETFDRT